jgi:hypothetical protein
MIWPPMAPNEIVVSQITGENPGGEGARGMGAWGTVAMKELMRLPLK